MYWQILHMGVVVMIKLVLHMLIRLDRDKKLETECFEYRQNVNERYMDID